MFSTTDVLYLTGMIFPVEFIYQSMGIRAILAINSNIVSHLDCINIPIFTSYNILLRYNTESLLNKINEYVMYNSLKDIHQLSISNSYDTDSSSYSSSLLPSFKGLINKWAMYKNIKKYNQKFLENL